MITDILLDVGGTGIKGCTVPVGGEIGEYSEFPSRSGESREVLVHHFVSIIRTLADGAEIRCIAMAFPGPFDYANGIPYMRGLAKYESLYGMHLREVLGTELGHEPDAWRFINDVSAYALGAASDLKPPERTLCVCLGTGAGSAFLVDGRISLSAEEGIPENGWIYCLPYRDSVIDDYFSDRGIRSLAAKAGLKASPLKLNQMAQSADPDAVAVWDTFGNMLAEALRPILKNFNANGLVLGGKIAGAFRYFGKYLEAECRKEAIRLYVEPDTTRYVLKGLQTLL